MGDPKGADKKPPSGFIPLWRFFHKPDMRQGFYDLP